MLDCWQRRHRRRVRGMMRLGRVLAELIDDDPFPESELEIQVVRGLRDMGVAGLRPQYRPPWYDGVRGIVDLADPTGRTIIECDGRRHRQVTQAHDDDRRRDRLSTLHGWATVRIGWRELVSDRERALAQIAEIVLLRRRAVTTVGQHDPTARGAAA